MFRTHQICLLAFASIMVVVGLKGQFSFGPVMEAICVNGEPYNASANWEMYHTMDNTWYGERDTSYCFDAFSNYDATIDQGSYAEGRPVFLRYIGEPILLEENRLYAIGLYDNSEGYYFDLENLNYCNDGFCQGILVGVEIPANPSDTLNTVDMRWHQGPFIEDLYDITQESGLNPDGTQFLCFPSEKFVGGNLLREIILKIIPIPGASISLSYLILHSSFEENNMPGNGEPNVWGNNAYLQSNYDGLIGTLVLHTDTAYPDAEHQSYFDIELDPNPDTISEIQFFIQPMSSLVYQPFSNIRGGLVEGSDTLRHNLNYIIEGGGICLVGYMDVIIKAHDSFTYRKGDLSFLGKDACLQFQPKGKLRIAQGAHFICGSSPAGILLLCNDADIRLARDAQLTINNKLTLFHRPESEEKDVHIYLNPFTSLDFGSGSQVRDWSDGLTKLHIHLRGGRLDTSTLSDESMELIVIHHEEPEYQGQEIQVLGNPAKNELLFGWNSDISEVVQLSIWTSDGRLVCQSSYTASRGLNYESLDVAVLSSGLHILEITGESSRASARFIKE